MIDSIENSIRKYTIPILVGILILASVMRFWGIHRGDPITDEVLIAFRAIGMIDFTEATDQTTPWEWFDPFTVGGQSSIPWWAHISFHDHPPVTFLFQHFFIGLFGETLFGFRLPSLLLGLGSVFLLYSIGSLLYSRIVGIIGAVILAVTVTHVHVSTIGLQEGYVIFFMLLAVYLFLRALSDERFLLWTGVALGFAFLTKYTLFILVPIFVTYLVFFRRDYFFKKQFWISVGVAFLLFSPVIIYNIELYRAVGHFDFQFSYVFGQDPDVWQVAPGKEIGTIRDRIENFIPILIVSQSWVLLLLFSFGLVVFGVSLVRDTKEQLKKHAFLCISLIYILFLLLVFVGVAFRFLFMLTPFIVLGVAILFDYRLRLYPKFVAGILVLFLVFEIGYAFNSVVAYYSKGSSPWTYSAGLRSEKLNGGYNDLTKFLNDELEGKMPALAFGKKYKFLEDIGKESIDQQLKEGRELYSAMIIFDQNIDGLAQLWTLDRLGIYHAWPVSRAEDYLDFLSANGYTTIAGAGFDHYYYIAPTEEVFLRESPSRTNTGLLIEEELSKAGVVPIHITNKAGKTAFRVYKF